MHTIVVGTRQSALALTQTGQVVEDLQKIAAEQHLDCEFIIRKIVTKGDRILDTALSLIGGKGLFVKELEQALLERSIDIAVHSLKDMPSSLPEGLLIGALPKRVDPRDCLISGKLTLDTLPNGARVGTGSLRRMSQLQHHRPDLQLEPMRGNIDSRIKKLGAAGFDAIVLAAAGLKRMGWEEQISEYISTDVCLPAAGQGALAVQCRESDEALLALLDLYTDRETALAVQAERAFLEKLNGGCQVPIGALGLILDPDESKDGVDQIRLTGMVGSPDGSELIKETMTGSNPAQLGSSLAQKLIERGADRILTAARGEHH